MSAFLAIQIPVSAIGVGAFIWFMRIPIKTRDYIVSKRYPGTWGNAYSRGFWADVAEIWGITRDPHLLAALRQRKRSLAILLSALAVSFVLQIAV